MIGRSFTRRMMELGGIWLLLVMVCLSVGCDGATPSSSSFDLSSREKADIEFEAGANRPPTANTLYALAKILAVQGRDPQCEVVLGRIIRNYPRFLPAYCDKAEIMVRHRRIDEAILTLCAGLAIAPGDPVLLNNLGMCRMLQGEYDDALHFFTKAASTVPYDGRYRGNMATALGMLGRHEESLALYEQVVPAESARRNVRILARQK